MEIGILGFFALVVLDIWFFEGTKIGNKIVNKLYDKIMKG